MSLNLNLLSLKKRKRLKKYLQKVPWMTSLKLKTNLSNRLRIPKTKS